jgi:hypothetical protein
MAAACRAIASAESRKQNWQVQKHGTVRIAAPERARSEGTSAPTPGHWAVGSDPTFFTDPIFPTRFPTELLTTGWELAPWYGQQPVKNAIFSRTKRHCKIQDNMGGNDLGNLCSSRMASNEGVGLSDAPNWSKSAITLSRKDWHSPAYGAVLAPVPNDECVPGSCPAGLMAEMGLRWWRRFAARIRMEDPDVKTFQ